jgi:hypothetical protein
VEILYNQAMVARESGIDSRAVVALADTLFPKREFFKSHFQLMRTGRKTVFYRIYFADELCKLPDKQG